MCNLKLNHGFLEKEMCIRDRVYTPLTGNPARLAQGKENPNWLSAPKTGAGGDRGMGEV